VSKKILIFLILLLIFLLSIGSFKAYVIAGEQTRYTAISEHLMLEQGYHQNDTINIDVNYCFSCLVLSYEPWVISVIYEDEPEAIYYYRYSNGEVTQEGLSGSTPDELYHHLEDAPPDIKKR
jgi:hypothetical protein